LQDEDPDEDGLAATAAKLDAERKEKEMDEASNLVVPSQKEIEQLLLKRRKEVCWETEGNWRDCTHGWLVDVNQAVRFRVINGGCRRHNQAYRPSMRLSLTACNISIRDRASSQSSSH
jgi:hypothetical protein